jgi:hypothetical protein
MAICGVEGAAALGGSVIAPLPAIIEKEVFDKGRASENQKSNQKQAHKTHAPHHSVILPKKSGLQK